MKTLVQSTYTPPGWIPGDIHSFEYYVWFNTVVLGKTLNLPKKGGVCFCDIQQKVLTKAKEIIYGV